MFSKSERSEVKVVESLTTLSVCFLNIVNIIETSDTREICGSWHDYKTCIKESLSPSSSYEEGDTLDVGPVNNFLTSHWSEKVRVNGRLKNTKLTIESVLLLVFSYYFANYCFYNRDHSRQDVKSDFVYNKDPLCIHLRSCLDK